jgi:hypothetical protein
VRCGILRILRILRFLRILRILRFFGIPQPEAVSHANGRFKTQNLMERISALGRELHFAGVERSR